jgi:2-polyprenyl-3-methyl-5-hydroxy-6-metoxy-1,4-benzoquinol methylase
MDRAGEQYWSGIWDAHQLPPLWRVESDRIADYIDKAVFAHLKQSLLANMPDSGTVRVLEAGCARSAVLPLIKLKIGYNVAGIDYSPSGCEQARLLLLREGVNAEIHCGDIFFPPEYMIESFDAVVSFGLIEHFSDTTDTVRALARFLKPGGVMFTNVPNLRGVNGLVQKLVDRKTYEIHVPLSDLEIREAHLRAGLDVLQCGYFLPVNFGILNLNSIEKRSMQWLLKKLVLAALARMSMAAWWWESVVRPLPVSRSFSPYVHCIALKPAAT